MRYQPFVVVSSGGSGSFGAGCSASGMGRHQPLAALVAAAIGALYAGDEADAGLQARLRAQALSAGVW